ncbi:MAG: GHKL domain-containing protein [Desulfobacteraceae bacterium]|nr:MAG: GHKL domain-containing protein [Desulfobacteraceae bacterium]
MVTMIVPVFIMAVGTAYCIHILSEYMRAAPGSRNQAEAILETYGRVGTPSFLAVLTTLIGLGSLYANKMQAVREFALFSCFGMISILLLLFSLMPALLSIVPLGRITSRPENDSLGGLLERLVDLHLKNRKVTLLLMALLAIAGLLGIFHLKVETNPVEYFKEHTSVYFRFHDIYQGMAGSFPINVVLDGMAPDYFEDPSHLKKISEAQEFLDTLKGVDKTISFADYLKLVNYSTNRFQPEFYVLPKEPFEIRMLMNSYKTLLGQDMFSRFMSQDLSRSNLLLRTHLSSSRDFLELRDRIRTYFRDASAFKGLQIGITGLGLVIAESSHMLTIGQIKSLSLTLILIFGVIFLLFMSVKVGFVALFPNFLPIILLFGITGWAGFRLSVTTTLIASIAIGLAVDDSIHYLFRYRLEFKRDPDRNMALRKTLLSVGRPMIMTTVTLCAGFSVLILSSFKPTSEFGILMIIALFTALLGDIMILPSLMLKVNLVTIWDLLKLVTIQDKVSDAVAHQLNQPLNAIKMGSDFIQMMIERRENIPEQTLSEVAAQISEQVDRASLIIHRLREFGQRSDAATATTNVNEAVRDVLGLMEHQFALQNTAVVLNLAEPLPPVRANRNRLKQVIFNLLTNAWEAMEEKKGTPAASQPNILKIHSFRDNNRIWVSISDTGSGMSGQEKERVFEPFFTTKEKGEGRGLGLAIALGIMRDYGGRIQLESQKWKGTTVTLDFPLTS